MTNIEEVGKNFRERLDQKTQDHAQKLQDDLAKLKESLLADRPMSSAVGIEKRILAADQRLSAHPATLPQLSVRLDGSDHLQQLDRVFLSTFRIGQYYPVDKLHYSSVYCETLQGFFEPFAAELVRSPESRQQYIQQLIKQAQTEAENTHGGGTFGVNFPGRGCYLNGWLFAYGTELTPRQVLQSDSYRPHIMKTLAHEKLGHGFLSLYSPLGNLKSDLGLTLVDIVRKFGLTPTDDPISSLRQSQSDLLFIISQLLEEGWANWVGKALTKMHYPEMKSSAHSLKAIAQAIHRLPITTPNCIATQSSLLNALDLLFRDETVSLSDLHKAVLTVEILGSDLDEWFGNALGQPLRYAVGELLFQQAALNLGTFCLPYAALIAANMSFKPQEFSISDLYTIFNRDPRLLPDARLAALSRIQLQNPGNIKELVEKSFSIYSFTAPEEIR